jgi:hypothetical protein
MDRVVTTPPTPRDLMVVPPAPALARIESLLGETHVTDVPVWVVTDVRTGAEVSAHLSAHAAQVWASCADVRGADPMPEDEDAPDPSRECTCPFPHNRNGAGLDYCRNGCREGRAVCDACEHCGPDAREFDAG